MTTFPYTPNQVQRSSSGSVGPSASSAASARDVIHADMSPCSQDLDVTKRDRFELLSAYLDGEVTPEERQQVLCWLQHDTEVRRLYDRLLALRQGMRSQVCPSPCDPENTVVDVFNSLNHRLRLATMASVGVAAISVLNLLSGGAGGSYSAWQTALVSQPDMLHIALDKPAFPIPEVVSSVDTGSPAGIPVESEL